MVTSIVVTIVFVLKKHVVDPVLTAEGSLWCSILALVVWDIFAVFSPFGPLGYIVREEQVCVCSPL
jgi:hypothetical protein